MFKMTPFFSMPKNIEKILTNQEYITAMLHPKGVFGGFVRIIHENPLRPEWGNVWIPESGDDMYADIYTENGWKKSKLREKVFDQLFAEYFSCFCYFANNKYKIMGIDKNDIDESQSDSVNESQSDS